MKFAAIFVFALAFCFVGCAASPKHATEFVVAGAIRSHDGSPVKNARVILYEDLTSWSAWSWNPWTWYLRPDRLVTEAVTKNDGSFSLRFVEHIPEKRLKMVIEKGNYRATHDNLYFTRKNVISVPNYFLL